LRLLAAAGDSQPSANFRMPTAFLTCSFNLLSEDRHSPRGSRNTPSEARAQGPDIDQLRFGRRPHRKISDCDAGSMALGSSPERVLALCRGSVLGVAGDRLPQNSGYSGRTARRR
jgi:hypothetical protein